MILKINLGDYSEALELLNYAIDSMVVPSDYGRIFAIRGGIHLLLKDINSACNDFVMGVRKNDELSKEFIINNCQQFLTRVETIE